MSSYEEEREKQIRENAEFLASLGIQPPVAHQPSAPKRLNRKLSTEEGDYLPHREPSQRVRKQPLSYNDDYPSYLLPSKKTKGKSNNTAALRRANPGRRVIHGRVYDPTLGVTCHQCRQKTTDPKIRCGNQGCTMALDHRCLLVRYNEDAVEILNTGEMWECPRCRGVCNCSFCMRKRNRLPTGQLATFIKVNGEEEAKKIVGGELSPLVVFPEPRKGRKNKRWQADESDDDQEQEGGLMAGTKVQRRTGVKRYATRQSGGDARRRIAEMAGFDSDSSTAAQDTDEDEDEDEDEDVGGRYHGREWAGWEAIPAEINCIVLI
ncbi:zinc-finger domain of monoamine-oxidase A repressor R1-domain-containing protein [Kickxella alabastrina]|uniref:zinc-finger domain of monoamine-oxidase A repressor R1-domain-containing protein n=1 Tax=Kickxella alabastrina TaxID=61397 RepID=UPI002220B595|nr:zinc-finger domain of monoamine-oxidase A repressor R1-domain-containing protein [Kickxella alabastrina]KAI7833476.1 zinc-finger domain of monoamine-oxidase A repressor R1-domain-containing protein [Kickxella alabastrina]